ncbi:MAG: hypothetical protein Q7U97_04950 [Rhodocyclaceae bacterium]|nr:hypothetical protein [Rhodocyclaceae bacterium]
MPNFSFVCRLLPLMLLAAPSVQAQTARGKEYNSIPVIETRRAAAMAAGIAAGEAAYAPFRQPIAEAWHNPAQVSALTAVAYPLVATAASRAACMAIAVHPETCLLREISIAVPGVRK